MDEIDRICTDAAAAALVALAKHNIPPDVQELLIRGDAARNIKPNALSACMKAFLLSLPSQPQKEG